MPNVFIGFQALVAKIEHNHKICRLRVATIPGFPSPVGPLEVSRHDANASLTELRCRQFMHIKAAITSHQYPLLRTPFQPRSCTRARLEYWICLDHYQYLHACRIFRVDAVSTVVAVQKVTRVVMPRSEHFFPLLSREASRWGWDLRRCRCWRVRQNGSSTIVSSIYNSVLIDCAIIGYDRPALLGLWCSSIGRRIRQNSL